MFETQNMNECIEYEYNEYIPA